MANKVSGASAPTRSISLASFATDHYAGDGSAASRELGEYQMNWWIDSIARAVAAIKADDVSLKLQNEFYEKSTHPLDTKQ